MSKALNFLTVTAEVLFQMLQLHLSMQFVQLSKPKAWMMFEPTSAGWYSLNEGKH